jgi:hypothetical protein
MSVNEKRITRREFVGTSAMIGGAAVIAGKVPMAMTEDNQIVLPSDFGPCPRKLEDFLRYIVQRRAAEGLNHLSTGEKGPKPVRFGTISNGTPGDMYLAYTASAAYRYSWSRFYRSVALRNRTFLLMDSTVAIRKNGDWDDGGLNSYFGLHGLALSVLSWKETGDVDPGRLQVWTDAVVKGADDGLMRLHYGPYRYTALTSQYANPEMYFLAGLAAAWKITGQDRYRVEAAHGLARYDEWLFGSGGLAYFLKSSPQHGYQAMAVKSIALYWDITGDPYALDFLKRLAPYFPNVIHRTGMVTDAEHPQIKHIFGFMTNPASPAIIALTTGEGTNRFAADAALRITADLVDDQTPSYGKVSVLWYNYQLCTYAAAALRLMEKHPMPEAVDPGARRVFMDLGFRGVRSQWDDFIAATTTRQMSDSVAGAYIADPKEKVVPIDSAVDGVFFEVERTIEQKKVSFSCTEWEPQVSYASAEGLTTQSSMSRLFALYWAEVPRLGDDDRGFNQDSDWSSIQHWAVWQDYLVGLSAMRSHGAGGDTGDVVRVRWRLSPMRRKLKIAEQTDKSLRFQYGRLEADLTCLDDKGGSVFKPEKITEEPREAWTPLLTRAAPWAAGDYVNAASVIRPAGASGVVKVRSLKNGAAALFYEPGAKKAHIWLVNLTRATTHYLMDVPQRVDLRTYKRMVRLPPVPPGQPAHAGLMGGEAAIFVLESSAAIDPNGLLERVRESAKSPLMA